MDLGYGGMIPDGGASSNECDNEVLRGFDTQGHLLSYNKGRK